MHASLPQVRVGVGVFIWKNGTFLMGRRLGSHGAGTWSVPGGHLEYGETVADCAIREVREETGLSVGNPRILEITEDFFPEDTKQYLTIWVETDWLAGEPVINEPDKWISQDWYAFQNLPEPLFEPCWQNLRAKRPELFR